MNGWLTKLLVPIGVGIILAAGNRFYDIAIEQAKMEVRLEQMEQSIRLVMNHIATNGE